MGNYIKDFDSATQSAVGRFCMSSVQQCGDWMNEAMLEIFESGAMEPINANVIASTLLRSMSNFASLAYNQGGMKPYELFFREMEARGDRLKGLEQQACQSWSECLQGIAKSGNPHGMIRYAIRILQDDTQAQALRQKAGYVLRWLVLPAQEHLAQISGRSGRSYEQMRDELKESIHAAIALTEYIDNEGWKKRDRHNIPNAMQPIETTRLIPGN